MKWIFKKQFPNFLKFISSPKKRVLVIVVKAHHLSFVQGHGLEQLKVSCSNMLSREVKNKV